MTVYRRFLAMLGTLRIMAVALAWALFAMGCGDDSGGHVSGDMPPFAAPWQRTEERQPCAEFDLLRRPLFGDLHIHTSVSADAYIFGTRTLPHDAYDFVRGASLPLADDEEEQTRSTRIDRRLDFAAVTDHAEFFGEVDLCRTPTSSIFDDEMCRILRQAEDPAARFPVTVQWLFPAGIPNPPASHEFCSLPGIDCDAAAVSVWKEMQAAAEEAYDRTSACQFTSFIGYEHTASPFGRHLHRNVIFRNHHVPRFAASQLETASAGTPQGIWSAIEDDCLTAATGCDALIIPHNSNLSNGDQWLDPVDTAEAARRQRLEPLVELHQHKGNSECRFDRIAGTGAGTEDELCVFEQMPNAHEGPDGVPPPIDQYPRRSMVRNTLKDGLALEATLGVNPFKLGFVGSTDTHNANGGQTAESGWDGSQGNGDASPSRRIGRLRNNPGGLAVVWAEENSRDAIFDALRRRETYATSGTRPVVRLFAGNLDGVDCGAGDFVARAYEDGTPMGGDLGAARGERSPRFAVLAVKDPGTVDAPGTDLQRIQIVKGWVDALGRTRERVFDVAGDPDNGASVDPDTCEPRGEGFAELCVVWEDPQFELRENAFYYARVLENPTCRWTTFLCKSVGVDPFSADCAIEAAAAGERFAGCCLNEENDPFLHPVIQERAWTSPIWYRSDAIARVLGGVHFRGQGRDLLTLEIHFGSAPLALDPGAGDVLLRVTDNDEIFGVTIGADALKPRGAGLFMLDESTSPPPGLRAVSFELLAGGGAVLRVESDEMDLAAADRADHMVRVEIETGTYRASHTRLWRLTGNRLAPVPR